MEDRSFCVWWASAPDLVMSVFICLNHHPEAAVGGTCVFKLKKKNVKAQGVFHSDVGNVYAI